MREHSLQLAWIRAALLTEAPLPRPLWCEVGYAFSSGHGDESDRSSVDIYTDAFESVAAIKTFESPLIADPTVHSGVRSPGISREDIKAKLQSTLPPSWRWLAEKTDAGWLGQRRTKQIFEMAGCSITDWWQELDEPERWWQRLMCCDLRLQRVDTTEPHRGTELNRIGRDMQNIDKGWLPEYWWVHCIAFFMRFLWIE